MQNNGFQKIGFKRFVYEDGRVGSFLGYLRDCEDDENRRYLHLRVFDDLGRYYLVSIDQKTANKRKHPTYSIDEKHFRHKIIRYATISAFVNVENGHLLVPHKCSDKSCQAKVILFGGSSGASPLGATQ